MTDIKMFTDPDYEPARELDPQRLKQVQDARIKIADGAHGDEWSTNYGGFEKKLCIMEATYYILYGDTRNISDSPPCTSQEIRNFMVGVNDSITSDRKRAMLKAVIPDIINTAPIMLNLHKHGAPVKTFVKDPAYRRAERTRADMIRGWCNGHERRSKAGDSWEIMVDDGKITMKSVIEFVRELAAVAKFDKRNADTTNSDNKENSNVS